MDKDFVPFGPEWEKYMLTLPKKFLIKQLRDALIRKYSNPNLQVGTTQNRKPISDS